MKKAIWIFAILGLLMIAGCNLPQTLDNPYFSPSPEDGPFEGPVTITIKSPTADARIYYTLDGSEPEEEDVMLYTKPFIIKQSTLIKTIAYKDDVLLSSEIINGKFIINN